MLTRLIYASKAQTETDFTTLGDIKQSADRHNEVSGITGMLVFGTTSFLQVLEGDRAAINETYSRIAVDPRHHSLTLLQFTEISERSFQQWAMKLVVLNGVSFPKTASILHRFGATEDFAPFDYSAESALQLLFALSPQPAAA